MWERYRQFIITVIVIIVTALSTYYTTIESLKLEVAGKAEDKFVATLDKRISNLEIRLAENFATREDFYQLKEELLIRLSSIEAYIGQKERHGQYR